MSLYDELARVTELALAPPRRAPGELERSVYVLSAYVTGGYPGAQEGLQVACELADELRRRSDAWGLLPDRRDWLELERAELRLLLGRYAEAEEILGVALPAASSPARTVDLALLDAKLAMRSRQYPRAEERLARAEAALAQVENPVEHRELEAFWCNASVGLLLRLGLPDRAQAALARELELAREIVAQGGTRFRLDDALLDRVLVYQTLVRHEEVLRFLRGPDRDLPAPGSPAALNLELCEAISRVELECHGPMPEDRAERDSIALLRRLLAQRLPHDQLRRARIWLVTALLDRGEAAEAAREFERLLERAERGLETRTLHMVDVELVLEVRLALARGDTAAFPALLARVRGAWSEFLEGWRPIARTSAPLHFDAMGELAGQVVRLHVAVEGPERGAEAALAELMRGQAVESFAEALAAEAPGTELVRDRLLGRGEVALLHLPVRDEGCVLVIDPAGVRVHPLSSLRRIRDARRALDRALEQAAFEAEGPAWDAVVRAARELAGLVLPGEVLARVAAARGLALVAPENLGYVPFELLPGPDGEPLGNSVAVRYLPSLPVAAALFARRAARSSAPGEAGAADFALLCADRPGPVADARFDPLPVEPEALAALLAPHGEAHCLAGAAADRAGLGRLLARPPRVLQIVAHGYVDRSSERPAALVLAGGEPLLRADEVERLTAPPLVLLAACSAWEGPRRRGDDGRGHLPSAFLLAGADTVVAAEKALLLEPALALFTAFGRELRAGKAPARALTDARVAVCRTAATRRERAFAQLVHAVGLADEPLFAAAGTGADAAEAPGPVAASGTRVRWLWIALAVLGSGALLRRVLRRRADGTGATGCSRSPDLPA